MRDESCGYWAGGALAGCERPRSATCWVGAGGAGAGSAGTERSILGLRPAGSEYGPRGAAGSSLPSGPRRYASMTLRATGAAPVDPKPACSTMTAIAIRGASAGANAMNQALSRYSFLILLKPLSSPRLPVTDSFTTWSVPVFPAMVYAEP